MSFLGKERWGVSGLGSSACKIPNRFPSESVFEFHLPRQIPYYYELQRQLEAAELALAASGYGGVPNWRVVKVPGSIPGKIPKPCDDLGKVTKSIVRYEAVAFDSSAVWRVVHLRPSVKPREFTDRVPPAVWENEKTCYKADEGRGEPYLRPSDESRSLPVLIQPREMELELARRTEDLRQSNLHSTQEIQPMGASEGNLNSPLTGLSAVATGWEQDQLPNVSVRRIEWENPKDTDEGDFGIPSWVFEDTDEGEFGIPSWLFGFSLPDAVDLADLDWSIDDKKAFIEEEVLNTLNRQVRQFTGFGNTPKLYPLKPVIEEIQTSDLAQLYKVGRADRRLRSMGLLWSLPPWPGLNFGEVNWMTNDREKGAGTAAKKDSYNAVTRQSKIYSQQAKSKPFIEAGVKNEIVSAANGTPSTYLIASGNHTPQRCFSPMKYGTGTFENQNNSPGVATPPPEFCCLISMKLMSEPVMIASGQTYEREKLSQPCHVHIKQGAFLYNLEAQMLIKSHYYYFIRLMLEYFKFSSLDSYEKLVSDFSYFLKRLVSVAMDRRDKEKEMVSVLLSSVYSAVVKVKMKGKSHDDTVFLKKWYDEEPFEFKTDEEEVIDGLDYAVLNMKKGEDVLVTIHLEYAIGFTELKQDLAVVPTNSILIHVVKLVSIVKDKDSVYALAMNDTGSSLDSGGTEMGVRVWDPGSGVKSRKWGDPVMLNPELVMCDTTLHISICSHNWGRIETSGNMLSFNVVTEEAFEVSLADVSQTQMQGETDVESSELVVVTIDGVAILTPRELAKQVHTEIAFYGAIFELSSCCVYGGSDYRHQEVSIRRGVDIIVGTPGRVKDFIVKGTFNLKSLRFRVLDEAGELSVIEGQIAWMVHIIAAILKIRQTIGCNRELQELIDAELSARVLQLINITDTGVHAQRYQELSKQRLDRAILILVQNFRRSYVEDQAMHSAKLYARLSELLGLNDHLVLLKVLVGKIATNLKCYAEWEDVIDHTLSLFLELASGYITGKLLLKLESTKFIIANHSRKIFPFLEEYRCFRSRITFYYILGFLVSREDGPVKFRSFMEPLLQVAVNREVTTDAAFKTDVVKYAFMGLMRDLRGIAMATNSRRTYGLLVDWMYSSRMPLLLRAILLWVDEPEVTTPLLKFMYEFVLNKAQRLTFDSSSPNGILLFREISKLIGAYGSGILLIQNGTDIYGSKYKGMWISLTVLSRVLCGNYVNFGVFELYGDRALTDVLNISLKVTLSVQLFDIIAFKRLSKAYYGYMEVLFNNHISFVLNLETSTFVHIVSMLELVSFTVKLLEGSAEEASWEGLTLSRNIPKIFMPQTINSWIPEKYLRTSIVLRGRNCQIQLISEEHRS